MELVVRNQHQSGLENILSMSDMSQIDPAVFSSLGILLSSLSGMLFHYQQYATAGVVYLMALICHGLQRIIRTATNQTTHATRMFRNIKLHLSNTVVISMVITSQLSSPLPGMILSLILVSISYNRFKSSNWN